MVSSYRFLLYYFSCSLFSLAIIVSLTHLLVNRLFKGFIDISKTYLSWSANW